MSEGTETHPAVAFVSAVPKRTWIVVGIVIVAIIILVLVYRAGKKKTTIAQLPVDNAATGNQSTGVGDAQISQTATDIYNDLNGFNWFAEHDEAPYNTGLSFSDTDFVKLYNFFNTKYQGSSAQTLTQWINSDSAIPYSPWDTIKTAWNKRAGKLNLK